MGGVGGAGGVGVGPVHVGGSPPQTPEEQSHLLSHQHRLSEGDEMVQGTHWPQGQPFGSGLAVQSCVVVGRLLAQAIRANAIHSGRRDMAKKMSPKLKTGQV